MALFRYYANDKYGVSFRGQMHAENVSEVIARLSQYEIIPIKVKRVNDNRMKKMQKERSQKITRKNLSYRIGKTELEKNKKGFTYISSLKKVKPNDIISFTQNLYLLKKADFNNVHALETLVEATENINLRVILEDILKGVEEGQNMYKIMEYYTDVFPPIYIGIIKSGELSGTLVNSLEQARLYMESSIKLKNKLRSILLPNVAQFLFIILMLIGGTLFIIPKIEDMYAGMGLQDKIPAGTVAFGNAVEFLIKIWYIDIIIIGLIVFLIYMYIRTPEGRYRYDLMKYKIPVFGQLIIAIDLQKFLNALKLNLENGMRLQDSIDLAKEVIKNMVFLSILETAKNNLMLGENWVEPFERSNLFSKMVPEMLKIGMETDIAEMVGKIEEYTQIEIDRKLEKTIKVLPQLSYGFVGVVLIIFVIVIMVPIMNVYMGSFLFDAYL